MRELYVVEFESANYAGAGETALVWANSKDDAEDEFHSSGWGEEFYRQQDYDQFVEEYGEDEGAIWSTIISCQKLAGSTFEQYVNDPTQKQFYQLVNSK